MKPGLEHVSGILTRVLLTLAEQETDRPFDLEASHRIEALRLKLETSST